MKRQRVELDRRIAVRNSYGWIRLEPTGRETLKAVAIGLAAGAAVGSAAFYFTRLLIARRELVPAPPQPTRNGER